MKAASPDFKRKVHKWLTVASNPLTMSAAICVTMGACLLPGLYQDYFGRNAQDKQQHEEETVLLQKRIDGIVPMRKYVTELKEKAEVVLKLPADAMPPGTDAAKLRQQGEKLDAAVKAEVKETAIAIWLAPHQTLKEANDLTARLAQASGTEPLPGAVYPRGALALDYNTCQAMTFARPGFKPGEDAVKEILSCTSQAQAPYNRAAALLGGSLVLVFAGACFGRLRLCRTIAAEDTRNAEIDAGILPATSSPQPVINTSTGQDITVKPIKIAKTAAP